MLVTEMHGTSQSTNGELFLRLPLSENLTEDTGAGKLILTSVRSALVSRTDQLNKKVFEAVIEGKGKDYVFLTLTPECVAQMKLSKGMKVEVGSKFYCTLIWNSRYDNVFRNVLLSL